MLVQKPTNSNVRRRHLSEEEHYSKDHHEVHEVESLVKGQSADNVVCVSLIVQRSGALNDERYPEEVNDEITTCVDERPDVNVTGCIEALVIVEHGLSFAADPEHRDHGQKDGKECVNW